MTDYVYSDTDKRMLKTLAALGQELAKIRTGRAHPDLLEHVTVNCYGTDVSLSQVANVNAQDARTLVVTAFDRNTVPAIERAITNANLGVNPVTVGELIRVPLPPLTEARRKALIKLVRAEAEKAKVAVRQIRRDANQRYKNLLKEKEITKDEHRNTEEKIQQLTDKYIAEVDKVLVRKESEMMEI